MMAINRNDSPTNRKPAAQFTVFDEKSFVDLPSARVNNSSQSNVHGTKRSNEMSQNTSAPLSPSKMINQILPVGVHVSAAKKVTGHGPKNVYDENQASLDKLLASLVQQHDYAVSPISTSSKSSPSVHSKQETVSTLPTASTTSGSERFGARKGDPTIDTDEMFRLKQELQAARSKIAVMGQELSQQRSVGGPAGHNLPSPVEMTCNDPWNSGQAGLEYPLSAGSRDDSMSDSGIAIMTNAIDRRHGGVWLEDSPALMPLLNAPVNLGTQQPIRSGWNAPPSGFNSMEGRFGGGFPSRPPGGYSSWQTHQPRIETSDNMQYRGPSTNSPPEQSYMRPSLPHTRPGSAFGSYPYGSNNFNVFPTTGYSPPITPLSYQQPGMSQPPSAYQPRPIGTPLSPTAREFNACVMGGSNGGQQAPWNAQSSETTSGYVPPMEPLNYRRLLDRNMNCNWKFIVDKIVQSNDQQASIFLQQKLKVSSPEQKFDIVDAIIAQAYPLMVNRFGNFLVQRCFEHGTPDQIISIANSIRGNTLALSMDPFGCHVVQKAFDVVPEDYKAIMVHELLRRIPETVIHRYACHVWQKLFELRWSDSPPQIMKYVNEALRGMWHEVALGETGSLVVQNIFENCLEEDKRPCINEVLGSIDVVSHGQFGNWCIQHICEHGGSADKGRAIEHVLRFATEYSTDQFASKVVEKCLKVAGTEFLDHYLERVCEGRADRPRMPLIDIAGDQYGNYLIQYILIHADAQRREIVAAHIRKHMVSLRGSKFGSRVAMLCCNPASATRPGPAMGMPSRFGPSQPGTSTYGVNPSMPPPAHNPSARQGY